MRALRILLKVVGAFVAIVVLCVVGVFGTLWFAHHRVQKMAERIHPGMTAHEFVQVFPEGYLSGKVLRTRRTVACRTKTGSVEPPEDPPSDAASRPVNAAELQSCEAVSWVRFHGTDNDRLRLELASPGIDDTESRKVTRDDFARLLDTEFASAEYYVGFSYTTSTPQHISFGVWFGRDGRVREVLHPWGWD